MPADRDAPAVARATALAELAPRISPENVNIARSGLSDPDPMVRIGALEMLEDVPAGQVWPAASPLLSDPVSRGPTFAHPLTKLMRALGWAMSV